MARVVYFVMAEVEQAAVPEPTKSDSCQSSLSMDENEQSGLVEEKKQARNERVLDQILSSNCHLQGRSSHGLREECVS